MATKLNRAVTRETSDRDPCWNQVLMVRLNEGGRTVDIWAKGRRKHFTLTYAELWRLGFNKLVWSQREEKRKRQRERKRARKSA